jgi:hypothetical protein
MLMKYTENKFEGKNIKVDFNEYVACEFSGCHFSYEGGKPPVFDNCTFDGCDWVLKDRAENTLKTLAMLYHTMGDTEKAFAEDVLNKVKSNAV